MKLIVLRSLWTNGFDLAAALGECSASPYDGVEGPVPAEAAARAQFAARLRTSGAPFIAELALGGGYVPTERSPRRQEEEFLVRAESALECRPLFLTALAGCDSWPLNQSVDFLGRLIAAAARLGVGLSVETHRSRPTFSPWATAELLRQLPALRLTCDFSHWCCVCERLVLDAEPELLALCAQRVKHVHARVGYDQGPQAPDPAAPAYRAALAAHERWWDVLWVGRQAAGAAQFTLTPEFGPDGYLQTHPTTGAPSGDLDEINRWMAARQRGRYQPLHAARQA